MLEFNTCVDNSLNWFDAHESNKWWYSIKLYLQWARMVGKMSRPRVRVPVHSAEHYIMLAKLGTPLDENMPGEAVLLSLFWKSKRLAYR